MPTSRSFAFPQRSFSLRLTARSARSALSTLSTVAFSLVALSFVSVEAQADDLVRVKYRDKGEYLRLIAAFPEATDCGSTSSDNGREFVVTSDRLSDLQTQGFDVEVVQADLNSFYGSRISGGGLFGDFHTYTEAIAAMDAFVAAYPDLISPKFSIGQTIEGREMWVYKISDNPTVDEDEAEVFFNAYIHAREAITFEIIRNLSDHLLSNYGTDPDVTELVDNREIYLLPVTNPDGVEYNAQTDPGGGGLWRKNRRQNSGGSFGVDLNRNFGFNWGYDNSGSSGSQSSATYRGTAPFSEPETQNIRAFVNSREFGIIINYHSWGDLEIYSPEYDSFLGEDYDELLALTRKRTQHSGYIGGTTWQILYPINGGATDWMQLEETEKPPIFTILTEVGEAFWPPESQIPALVAENLESNLEMIELADNPLRALDPAPSVVDELDTVGRNFTLTWGDPAADPDNPAVAWNLIESTGRTEAAEDFESASARWDLEGFSFSTNRAFSGTQSLHSSQFQDDRNDIAVSRRAYLVEPGDELTFMTWYNIEPDWDYGFVEISADGRTYEPLAGSITTTSNPNGRNTGNGVTGSSGGGWVEATFDLSAYEGQSVWIRFRFQSDGATNRENWYIDDISPWELFATSNVIGSELTESQFTFVNKLDGIYFYRVEAIDPDGDLAPYSPSVRVQVTGAASTPNGPDSRVTWGGIQFAAHHPFQEEARMSFRVPQNLTEGDAIRLTVHDAQGRQAMPPLTGTVGGELRTTSDHIRGRADHGKLLPGSLVELQWTANDVGTGVYFVALTAGEHQSQKRVILMR